MSKLTCSLVLLALLGLGMVPSSANAGEIVVYFDQPGTQRSIDAGPVGNIVNMSVYGEGFEGDVPFVSGAQFQVDYGANIDWLADVPLFGAFIGNTQDGLTCNLSGWQTASYSLGKHIKLGNCPSDHICIHKQADSHRPC